MFFKKNNSLSILLLASVISCFIAFVNNFPLVYQDTGSYIHSGFENVVFSDRPIFYGLFIRHISLSSSLWYVVFAQGFLICYLIFLTLDIFFTGTKKNIVFISLITFLTLTTGFSYNVSILIPDIFSAISILCLVNLIINKKLNRLQFIFIALLFIFSISTQFSSIAIFALLFIILVLFLFVKKFRKQETSLPWKKVLLSLALFLFSLILIPTVHFVSDRKFQISRSNHVFIMNHLVESGVLEEYLKQSCASHNYKICQYKDSLGWDFIWSPESALQKTGGWEANETEYNQLIKDVISTPKYFILLAQKSVEYTFKQFFTFHVTLSAPQTENSAPLGQIIWRYKDCVREYVSDLQNNSKLKTDSINFFQQIIVLISIVFLLVIVISRPLLKKLNVEIKWILIIFLIHNFINSFVCANLSTVHARFQNRLAWIFPMLAVIIIIKYLEERNKNRATD